MYSAGFDVSELVTLAKAFRNAPEFTLERFLAAMSEATQHLEREVKDAFPIGSGDTRKTIFSDAFSTPAGVLGVVGSASIAAAAVEFGTKPHMPPVEAIQMWVEAKTGLAGKDAERVAWGVARKIRRDGTPAQQPFHKTYLAQHAAVSFIFHDAVQDIAQHLVDGSRKGLA